jgi:CheY-like chemotaxis protein
MTKLLLIDDDRDDQFFFKEALKKIDRKFECKVANSGASGLELLRESASLPDYIFLDLNMQGMSGKDCLKELKSDARLKNIPVIICTTSQYQNDKNESLLLGAAHYLVKQFDISQQPRDIAEALEIARKASQNIL